MTGKRTPRKRPGPTAVLAALCGLLTIALTYDLGKKRAGDETAAMVIGELLDAEGEVYVRPAGRHEWSAGTPEILVRDGDELRTADGGRAEVRLIEGTTLVLDGTSLLRFTKLPAAPARGYRQLDTVVVQGAVHKRTPRGPAELLRRLGGGKSPRLTVVTGGSRLLPEADAEFTVSATEAVVRNGGARLETPSGNALLGAGDRAALPKTGSDQPPSVRREAFALLFPRAGERIAAAEGVLPIKLRWRVDVLQASEAPMTAELSTDPAFRDGVQRQLIAATYPPLKYVEAVIRVEAPSESQVHYWRVRTSDGRLASSVERFLLSPAARPAPLHPSDAARAHVSRPLSLAWSRVTNTELYELEVRSQSGDRVAHDTRTAENFASLRERTLAPGEYAWRVRARAKDGALGRWSDPRRLILIADSVEK